MNDDLPLLDLSHLTSMAQQIALLPENAYRPLDWLSTCLRCFEALFAWPIKQRMANILIVGPTNNGKSMIIEKFRRTHPSISKEERGYIPVLSVQMPSEPSVSRFYAALLAVIGAPFRPGQRLIELENMALL